MEILSIYTKEIATMFHIKVIKHQDITKQELDEVIAIKSKQWHYNYEQQLNWINSNIKENDIHILLQLGNSVVAYLNLIDIDVEINENSIKGYGVGNVCAIEKGKGFGFEIMKEANSYILDSKKVGLLFCKQPLLRFYKSLSWNEVEPKNYKINGKDLNVMIFNVVLNENMFVVYNGIDF